MRISWLGLDGTTESMRDCKKARYDRLGPTALALWALLALIFVSQYGCASTPETERRRSGFNFESDTFAYTNNNYWIYDLDAESGGTVVKERRSNIEHGQRCTIMSRTARQFFYAAKFAPDASRLSTDEYRERIRRVLETDPRSENFIDPPILFPGYRDLRSFSEDHEETLKAELGGRWLGYFQRGNWRMIFPFSARQKRATALELVDDLARGHLPIVHVVNYPRVNINHTVLVFDALESPVEIRFDIYDPNNSKASGSLVFDRESSTFRYYRTDYFAGGRAMVYEIYDGALF